MTADEKREYMKAWRKQRRARMTQAELAAERERVRKAVASRRARQSREERSAANERWHLAHTRLREPSGVSQRAGALRWDRLAPVLKKERSREERADSRDAELCALSEIWT